MPEPKLSVEEFAGKIKAKYPDYQDIPDAELAQKMLTKYPEYANQVEAPSAKPLKKKDIGQPVSDLAPRRSASPSASIDPLKAYKLASSFIDSQAKNIQSEWSGATPENRKELEKQLTGLQGLQREAEGAVTQLLSNQTPTVSKEMDTYLASMAQMQAPDGQKPYVPGAKATIEEKRQRRTSRLEAVESIGEKEQRMDLISKDIASLEAAPEGRIPFTSTETGESVLVSANEEQKQERIKEQRTLRNQLRLEVADEIEKFDSRKAEQMRAAVGSSEMAGSQDAYNAAFESVYAPIKDEVRVLGEIEEAKNRLNNAKISTGTEVLNKLDETLGVASYLPKLIAGGEAFLLGETQKILNFLLPESLEDRTWVNLSNNYSTAFKSSMGFTPEEQNQSWSKLLEDGKYKKGLGLLGSDAFNMYLLMSSMAGAQGYGNMLKMAPLERKLALETAYGGSFLKGASKAFQYNILENPALASFIFMVGAGNAHDQVKNDPYASEFEKTVYPYFGGLTEMITEMFFINNLKLFNKTASTGVAGEGRKAFIKGFMKSAKQNTKELVEAGFLEEGVLEEGLSFYADGMWQYMSRGEKLNPREFFESAIIAGISMAPVTIRNTAKEVTGIYKMANSPRYYMPLISEIDKGAGLKSELSDINKSLEKTDISEQERQILTDAKAVVETQIEEAEARAFSMYSRMNKEDINTLSEIHSQINDLAKTYGETSTSAAKKAIGDQVRLLVEQKRSIEEKYDSEKEIEKKYDSQTQGTEVEAKKADIEKRREEELNNKQTIQSLVNERVIYRDPISETLVEGDMFVEGQRVIIEEEGGRQFDVGNIEEILSQPLTDESVVQPATLTVVPQEDGSYVFNIKGDRKVPFGTNMVNTQPGLQAITRDKEGKVSRVTFYSKDGKNTYNLRGQQAIDAAYYVVRNFVETVEGQQAINDLLETNEEARQDLTKALERLARIPQVAEEEAVGVRPKAPTTPVQQVEFPISVEQKEQIETPASAIAPELRAQVGDVVVMRIGNVLETPGANKDALKTIDRYINVLYNVLPDVTVVLHRNQASIDNSHQDASEATEGYYSRGKKQIHILVENLEKGLVANDERVLRHEIIHPILDALIKESPVFVDNMGAEILNIVSSALYVDNVAVAKLRVMASQIAKDLVAGNKDAVLEGKKELITEFFAQFSDEKNFNALKKNPTLLEKIKALLNRFFQFLGVKYRIQTYADLLDTLKKFKNSFDQGKAFDVASTSKQSQAIDSIAQSVRPAPFADVSVFGITSTSVLPQETEPVLSMELEASIISKDAAFAKLPDLEYLSEFLDKLSEITQVPYIFVDLAKEEASGISPYGAKYTPLNLVDQLAIVDSNRSNDLFGTVSNVTTDFFDEITSKVGYSIKEGAAGFLSINISSSKQALYSYSAIFLESIKATNPFKFNAIMENVVKERYLGKDQAIIRAREIYQQLIQKSPNFLAEDMSGKEFAAELIKQGIESLSPKQNYISQIAYVSIASSIYEIVQDNVYAKENNIQYLQESETVNNVLDEASRIIGSEVSENTPFEVTTINEATDLYTIAKFIFSNDYKTNLFQVDQSELFRNMSLNDALSGLMSISSDNKDNLKRIQDELINADFKNLDSITPDGMLMLAYERAQSLGVNTDNLDAAINSYRKDFINSPDYKKYSFYTPQYLLINPSEYTLSGSLTNRQLMLREYPALGYKEAINQFLYDYKDFAAQQFAETYAVSESVDGLTSLGISALRDVTALATDGYEVRNELDDDAIKFDATSEFKAEESKGLNLLVDSLKLIATQIDKDLSRLLIINRSKNLTDNINSLPTISKLSLIKSFGDRFNAPQLRDRLKLVTKNLLDSGLISKESHKEIEQLLDAENGFYKFINDIDQLTIGFDTIAIGIPSLIEILQTIKFAISIADNFYTDTSESVNYKLASARVLAYNIEDLVLSLYANSSSLLSTIMRSGYDGGWTDVNGKPAYGKMFDDHTASYLSSLSSGINEVILHSPPEFISDEDKLFTESYDRLNSIQNIIRFSTKTAYIQSELLKVLNAEASLDDALDFGENIGTWIMSFKPDIFEKRGSEDLLSKMRAAKTYRELVSIANSKEVKAVAPDLGSRLSGKFKSSRQIIIPVDFVHPDAWYVHPDFRGKTIKGYYKLSLTLRASRVVDVEYSTSEYQYSNTPPYLLKGPLSNIFLKLSETITKTYPDIPILGIEFGAIRESQSMSRDAQYFYDQIDLAQSVNHPNHAEGVRMKESFDKAAAGNFRRLYLNALGFKRAVSGEFSVQTKDSVAVYDPPSKSIILVKASNKTKPGAAFDTSVKNSNPLDTLKAEGYQEGEDYSIYLTAEDIVQLQSQEPGIQATDLVTKWNQAFSSFVGMRAGTYGADVIEAGHSVYLIPPIYANQIIPFKVTETPVAPRGDISFSNRLNTQLEDAAKQGLENQERMQQEYLDEINRRGKSVGIGSLVVDIMSPDKGVFWDRQAGVKRKVRKIEKETGVPYLEDLIVTRAGAQGEAFSDFRIVEKDIYGSLSKGDLDVLDRIIFDRRVIQIEANRRQKVENANANIKFAQQSIASLQQQRGGFTGAALQAIDDNIRSLKEDIKFSQQVIKENQPNVNEKGQPLHPNKTTDIQAIEELQGYELLLGTEKFNDLSKRAEVYFSTFSEDLRKNFEAGRINDETYQRFKNNDYQPRLYLEKMFGPEDITFFEAKGMKPEYIKGIKTGSDLSVFTDSRALLAMQMQSTARAIAENRVNAEISKFASPSTADWLRPATYARDAKGQIITDPYDGYKVEPADKGFVNLFFREGGALRAVQMKVEDYRQWQDLNKSYFNLTPELKSLIRTASLSNILKLQATGINPLFGLFQMPADFVRAVLTRGRVYDDVLLPVGLLKAAGDLAKGLYASTNESNDLYRDWVKHGGAMQFLFQYGADTKARIIQKHRGGVAKKLSDIKNLAFHYLSFLNNATEVGMRLAVYQRAIKTFQKEYPNLDIEMIKFMAASESRKFADFHQGGTLSKDIDNLAAYFNAGVVTTKSTLDGIKENPGLFAAKIGQMFLFISGLMAYNLTYGDDDDWENVPDWEKSRYHIILLPFKDEEGKRMYIRIKKDYAMMPFFTMAEMASESSLYYNLKGRKKQYSNLEIKRVFELNSQAVPFFVPTIDKGSSLVSRIPTANLAVKYFANYDTFRGRVVSPDKNDDLPVYLEGAYDDRVEYFYKALGQGLDLSPARLKAASEAVILSPSSSEVTNLAYFIADYVAMSTYDLPYDPKPKKIEQIMDVSLKNLERNTLMRGMRSVNPNWKAYLQQEEGGDVKRIKQVEAEEDFILRKKLGQFAKRDAEELKEGAGVPAGLPKDVKEYIVSLPEQKRRRAANTYVYQLRSKHFKLDVGYYPILFARTSTEAAKQFELFIGSADVSKPEVKEALRDLVKAGFYTDKEFKFALAKLNKESQK